MDRIPDVTFATTERSDDECCTEEEENLPIDPTAFEGAEYDDKPCPASCWDSRGSCSSSGDENDAAPAHTSLDTMRGIGTRSAAFEDVYEELHDISARLKMENRLLHEREMRLKTREEEIERAYKKLAHVIHRSADEKCSQVEMKAKEKILILSKQLKEKCNENKRLRGNFEALRLANDELKKQLESLQSQHEVLEKQASSLKQRLENLQRKQEFKDRQTEDILTELKPKLDAKPVFVLEQQKKKLARKSAVQASTPALYDALSLTLEWIVRDVLAPSCSRGAALDAALRFRIVDSAQHLTPLLVRRLKDDWETAPKRIGLPCLQFIHWGCLLAEQGQTKQTTTAFLATMRHLCEELYRPLLPVFVSTDLSLSVTTDRQATHDTENDNMRSRLVFVKSPDLHVRLLSCLLLLRNLNQADLIANAFDLLKTELKEERSKELFVYYHGMSVLIQYFKPTAKVHLSAVLDVCMLLAVESTVTAAFLESCSTEAWFRSCAMVLKIPNLDERLLEKISVILQKLSKIRSNRKHFDMFQLKSAVQEIMRTVSTDSSSFTILNCKSVLFNLS